MYFFTTVEFYVILAVAAAAILAFAGRPPASGPVREILLACAIDEDADCLEPSVRLDCLPNGRIRLTRTCVTGLCGDGAVSLAIEIKGFDIKIEERITQGRGLQMPSATATCVFPFIKLDRYHVAYNSASTGLFTAFTFPARIGSSCTSVLRQG